LKRERMPIWMKFFYISFMSLFMVVVFMSLLFLFQMAGREENILESGVSDNIYYSEINLNKIFLRYKEQISATSLAQDFFQRDDTPEYRGRVRKRLSDIYAASSEILAVFYQDSYGEIFSSGEIFHDLNRRKKIVQEYKSNPLYNRGEGMWRYEMIGRNYHSVALCKDIIYIDANYNQHECGTMVLFIDANNAGEGFFREKEGSGIFICDPYDVIVFSSEEESVGKAFRDIFEVWDEKRMKRNGVSYIISQKECDILGWKVISCTEENITGKNISGFILAILIFGFLVLVAVAVVFFIVFEWMSRPVEELFQYITIDRHGEVTELPGIKNKNEFAQIKNVFDSMRDTLAKIFRQTMKWSYD